MQSLRSTRVLSRSLHPSIFPAARHYATEGTSTAPRPKIHDAAYKFSGNAREVEEHNRSFEKEGIRGPLGTRGATSSGNPSPRIHDAAGKFNGSPEEVERHNKEFENRKGGSH